MKYSYRDERTGIPIQVYGQALVSVESTPRNYRNTRIEIIKTQTGKYAVVTSGISRLFHGGSNPCKNKRGDHRGEAGSYRDLDTLEVQLKERYHECPDCNPAPKGDDDDPLYIERDLSKVSVCNDADQIYRTLCGFNRASNSHFLTNLGKKAWEALLQVEPSLKDHTIEVR